MANEGRKRLRTCIACGTQSDKVDLHRIVRSPDGGVRFDATGRLPGRGAYVCSSGCLAAATEKGKLQRSLKCNVGKQEAAEIAVELERALDGAGAR